jgi:uncharacterized iron-regulated membrane protein
MAGSTTMRLRSIWFQLHKWIGILLVVLLIPLSLTGSALVWHDGLETLLYPQRFMVTASDKTLLPSAYIAAAKTRLEANDRISSLRFGKDGEPVMVMATRAPAAGVTQSRSLRISVWLDPANAAVLDAASNNEGIIRVLHNLHGSFMIPGVGRQIVGWLGVAMFISCLTGIWLWWPSVGRWTRGLRWRRSRDLDTNLHHLTGFWIAIPLAMLCFTGAWISFPAFFGMLSGEAQRSGDRMATTRALPIAKPQHDVDSVLAAVEAKAEIAVPYSIDWPSDKPAPWKIMFADKRHLSYTFDDASGIITLDKSPAGNQSGGLARTMRQWHDGTGMGLIWQVIIFIGGIIPALLGITGILMWLRTRQWRSDVATRRDRTIAPAE